MECINKKQISKGELSVQDVCIKIILENLNAKAAAICNEIKWVQQEVSSLLFRIKDDENLIHKKSSSKIKHVINDIETANGTPKNKTKFRVYKKDLRTSVFHFIYKNPKCSVSFIERGLLIEGVKTKAKNFHNVIKFTVSTLKKNGFIINGRKDEWTVTKRGVLNFFNHERELINSFNKGKIQESQPPLSVVPAKEVTHPLEDAILKATQTEALSWTKILEVLAKDGINDRESIRNSFYKLRDEKKIILIQQVKDQPTRYISCQREAKDIPREEHLVPLKKAVVVPASWVYSPIEKMDSPSYDNLSISDSILRFLMGVPTSSAGRITRKLKEGKVRIKSDTYVNTILTKFKKQDLVSSPMRGQWKITEKGKLRLNDLL